MKKTGQTVKKKPPKYYSGGLFLGILRITG